MAHRKWITHPPGYQIAMKARQALKKIIFLVVCLIGASVVASLPLRSRLCWAHMLGTSEEERQHQSRSKQGNPSYRDDCDFKAIFNFEPIAQGHSDEAGESKKRRDNQSPTDRAPEAPGPGNGAT